MQQPKPFEEWDDADLYDCQHVAAEAAMHELLQQRMAKRAAAAVEPVAKSVPEHR
jgi:hypothetical protein